MRVHVIALCVAILGCSSSVATPPTTADGGGSDVPADVPAFDVGGGRPDAPTLDAPDVPPSADRGTDAVTDAPSTDVGVSDAGTTDVGAADVGAVDAGAVDAGAVDAGAADVGTTDVGAVDAGCARPGEFICGGACVGRSSDPLNCGACGNVCPAARSCVAGSCLGCGGCSAGFSCCGPACINLQTDSSHCGACGNACPAGQSCQRGMCGCPAGQTACGGVCVDTSTSRGHCGGCGQNCCAGHICSGGGCSPGCSTGLTACPVPRSTCSGGICVDARIDPANCGGCGVRCAAGETCAAGRCQGDGFTALDPCPRASDYVAAGTVRFGGDVGSAYSPRCVTVRAGGSLVWEGEFSGHPLRPSDRGTSPNPIPAASTGERLAVTLPSAGFFPFFCAFHGSASGGGMAGVVRVIP